MVKPDIEQELIDMAELSTDLDASNTTEELGHLGFDSLDVTELEMMVEDRWGFDIEISFDDSISDVADRIGKLL